MIVFVPDSVGATWAIATSNYGTFWRDARKAFHLEFQPSAVSRFRHIEQDVTASFLGQLLEEPEGFMKHTR